MAQLKSPALSVAKIALVVKRVRRAYRARAFHPAHEITLLVDIVASQPRCLTSSRFFFTINIEKDAPSFGIGSRIAPANAPLFRFWLLDTPKGVSKKRFPIHVLRCVSGFHRLESVPNGPVQRPFSTRIRVCALGEAGAEADAPVAAIEQPPLIPRTDRLALWDHRVLQTLLEPRHRPFPFRPRLCGQPRVQPSSLLKREPSRALVPNSPCCHLPRRSDARVQEQRRRLDAQPPLLFCVKERNGFKCPEMRSVRMQRVALLWIHLPSPVFPRPPRVFILY